ncbi:hypothetical protein LP420_38385 [Massilia sp. B-10]|nr:hypothetical protein LP420_38385 [Massilia sp. B-10]
MRAKLGFTGMLLLGLLGCASVAPPSTDIPSAVASALAPADHQKLADYYASKAVAYEAEAAQHDRIGRSYINRNARRHDGNGVALPGPARPVRRSGQGSALAQEHREVAAKGGN